jgi:hypothetical protein
LLIKYENFLLVIEAMSYKTSIRRDNLDVPLPPQSVPFQTLQNALFCEAQSKELQDNSYYAFGKPTQYSHDAVNKTKRHFEQYDDAGYDSNVDFTTQKDTRASPTLYTNESKCQCCNESSNCVTLRGNPSNSVFCESQEERRDNQSTSHSRCGREPSTYSDASHMMTKGYNDESCGRSVSSKFSSHSTVPSKNEKEAKFSNKDISETQNSMYENRSCHLPRCQKRSPSHSSNHSLNESHHNRNERERRGSPNHYLQEKVPSCYENSRERSFFTEPQYDSSNDVQSYASDTALSKPSQHHQEHCVSRNIRSDTMSRDHDQGNVFYFFKENNEMHVVQKIIIRMV